MKAAQRFAAFVVAVVAVFAVAVGVGKAVGPNNDVAVAHAPGDAVTPAGPEIGFHTAVPSSGDYRLFLDFQHEGVVRTAEFTVTVDEGHSAPAPRPADAGHGH